MSRSKIKTASITDDAVTSAKIDSATIATGDIADDAVTGTKLANDINIAGDLTVTGNDINTAGSMLLRPAGTEIVNISSTGVSVTGDVLPEANATRSLGSNALRYSNLYAENARARYFYNADDTNTYMEFPENDSVKFFANGGERVQINATALYANQMFGLGDTDTGIALGANGANIMQFYTGNAERARFTNDGLDFRNTTGTHYVLFKNGDGVHFGATQGSNTTSSVLDDYEEGTFTPTIDGGVSSATYSQQVGRYTKVGNLVHYSLHLDGNSVSASTGQIQFGGLPYTSLNVAHVWGGGFTVYTGGSFQKQNVTWAIQGGTTRVIGYHNNGAVFKGTDFDTLNGGWYINGFYYAA